MTPPDIAAEVAWQPIATAPKDKPILAWCQDDCQSADCGYHTNKGTSLCLYHAHAEGLSRVSDGPHVIEWGGEWADSWEDGGGSLPDWWFRSDSEFEAAANPVCWAPIQEPARAIVIEQDKGEK